MDDVLTLLEQIPIWKRENREPTRDERDTFRLQANARYAVDEAPILADLRDAGFDLAHVQDLWAYRKPYKAAVPVLIRWLDRTNNIRMKDTIARALTASWAKEAAAPLIREFRRLPYQLADPPKWAIGHALASCADDEVFDDIVELARDQRHGIARAELPIALGRMKNPRAYDILVELLRDPEIAGNAIEGLRKLGKRSVDARPKIEPFLSHPQDWVRAEAKKFIKSADRLKKPA